ncbi:MAG: permease [Candidatus Riflebacteria bacterium]|nr:permease [Candidatus Riflebacteria bacterium]
MSKKKCVAAFYRTHIDAEKAVKDLQNSGLNMKQCSILGRGFHTEEEVVGFYNAGDRMTYWGKQGAFWGGVLGLLVGSGFFWIPGIGTVMVGGALVSSIAGALEGAAVVGSLNVIGAGLYSIGIPTDSILECELAIKANKFVVIFHGTAEEAAKAGAVLDLTPKVVPGAPTEVNSATKVAS